LAIEYWILLLCFTARDGFQSKGRSGALGEYILIFLSLISNIQYLIIPYL